MSTKLIFLLLFVPAAVSSAQSLELKSSVNEIGNLYYRNYTSKEYKGSFQNWGGLQDKHGIMFFSNGDGVLCYDGKTWTLIETPTKSVIRSQAMDATGKIFVGALDDFGYLDRTSNGKYIFVSLLDKVKPALHLMGNIWQTYIHRDIVYFEAETGLFTWNGERFEFQAWPDPNTYHKSFFWNEVLYLHEEGHGLLKLQEGKFLTAKAGDFFKDKRIYCAFPLTNGKILLATRYQGLFLYDGERVEPFQTQADNFLKEKQIYAGLMLPDSTYIFGTRQKGVAMIDQRGAIRAMINKENGLPSDIVLGLMLDRQGNLWIMLENGISKFEINSNLSLFNERNGLEGSTNDLERYNGTLYVTTSMGLYKLNPALFPFHVAHFEKVSEINVRAWNLLKTEHSLLISTDKGLFEIVKNDMRQVSTLPAYDLHRCKMDSNTIIVASNNQLQLLKHANGRWTNIGYIKNIKFDNISFNETHPGKIWISTFSQGTALLSFPEENGVTNYVNPAVAFFDASNGLPEGFVKINSIDGEEIFRVGPESKIFKFDYSTNHFKEDTAFARKYELKRGVFPISNEDKNGNVLLKTKKQGKFKRELIFVKPTGGEQFTTQRLDISRIFELIHVTSFTEKDVIWQGGSDGIVRFEFGGSQTPETIFNTYINKIVLLGDSIFFQGPTGIEQNLTFPYATNSFRFEFTANNFVAEETNEFQYKLEGYDDKWSDWTTENIKEYSRLWEGSYKFLVRSRNFAEYVGTIDEFSFVIAPPWYRNFYAFAVYFIGATFLVWGIVRWKSYNLIKEKKALEAEIAHQTQEIRQQNFQLAEQSEELKINAEQLKELDKMKSNFFVNISHEFRTPLSLILSPLEKYVHEKETTSIRLTEVERMHRNAKRLQQLINQLLDLAKLESGGMKMSVQRSDFFYFLKVVTASFESLAENRNINFDVDIPAGSYESVFDKEKTETILYNLLSNAFKFTPDGGSIQLQVKIRKDDNDLPISISISDSGPGIAPNELEKIFNRFYQVDSSSLREFEGSGIGLSLVKELILLINGKIAVNSSLGNGATFTIQLPLKHLAEIEKSDVTNSHEALIQAENLIKPSHNESQEIASLLSEATLASSDSLILLVEDNADFRVYLKENLENEYQIALAENGKTGLEKAFELTPDLILSDMMMPVMDGFTLCTNIRGDERTSHIPFILLTARASIESKLEGLELGADEYMTKPFNIKELKVRIKNLLEQRKKLRNRFSRQVTIQPKNIFVTSVDERFLNHALEIVENHLSDPQFSVERFAEEIGMSRKNLLRKIKALTDLSVNEFIRNFRLKRAAQLISAKSATVSEIAYQVGFNNLSYFSKCFKELFGVTPNEYEKV